MAWDHRYRPLKEGEVILATDETLNDETLEWEKARPVGQKAPDPAYTSHRWYRRLKDRSDAVSR
jgi:hypothetical protein